MVARLIGYDGKSSCKHILQMIMTCFILCILKSDIVADTELGGEGVKESIEKIRVMLLSWELYRPVKEILSAGKKVLSSG